MKNIIMSVIVACGLAFSSVAQDNNVVAPKNVDTSLFNANELSINIGSAVELDGSYQANFNAGLSYSITRNFVIETFVPFYQTEGVSVDRAGAGLAFRVPVARILAPTIHAGSFYKWNDRDFDYYLGASVEIKLNKKWSLIPGIDYSFDEPGSIKQGTWSPSVRVRLTF